MADWDIEQCCWYWSLTKVEYNSTSKVQLIILYNPKYVNTMKLRQNCYHSADDIFKCIFLNENMWDFINISLKFVAKGQINNILAFFHLMAWCYPGNEPLSEPMMVSLLMNICKTRPQWNKGQLACDISIFLMGWQQIWLLMKDMKVSRGLYHHKYWISLHLIQCIHTSNAFSSIMCCKFLTNKTR